MHYIFNSRIHDIHCTFVLKLIKDLHTLKKVIIPYLTAVMVIIKN